jgi:hypothetical protein
LNEDLNDIISKDINEPILDCELKIIYDYFNLCGEEYLYYKKGYIFPSAWKAWYNGMNFFINNSRISKVLER